MMDVECGNSNAKWEQYCPPSLKVFITNFKTKRDETNAIGRCMQTNLKKFKEEI